MSDIEYSKTRTVTMISADEREIISESYTDRLTKRTVETSKDIITTGETILRDVISCLDVLGETEECLTITIRKKKGSPYLITKTWVVRKEYPGK